MTHRMKMRAAPALLVLALAATAARGESTPEPAACSAEALGTARVLPVDAARRPQAFSRHPPARSQGGRAHLRRRARARHHRPRSRGAQARMRAGIVLLAGAQCARASAARPPRVERGPYCRAPHVFAS